MSSFNSDPLSFIIASIYSLIFSRLLTAGQQLTFALGFLTMRAWLLSMPSKRFITKKIVYKPFEKQRLSNRLDDISVLFDSWCQIKPSIKIKECNQLSKHCAFLQLWLGKDPTDLVAQKATCPERVLSSLAAAG